MRIIAIDPGYERVGIAVIETNNSGDSLLFSTCFKTDKKNPFEKRLLQIGREISSVIHAYKPTILAIETLFFNSNKTTAIKVSEARGVIIFQSVILGLELCEYTPLQVKIALTGYGRATKDQVNTMVRNIIHVNKEDIIDDEIDAIAIGLTCSASYNSKQNI